MGSIQDAIYYTYGNSNWGDLLTAYDGKPITYDTIGNPLTYDGWTFTWEHGRELASMAKNGTTWSFTYDANGLRTKRTNGTTTYQYVYNGSKLTQMSVNGTTVYFAYHANGHPDVMIQGQNVYHYITNLRGDVMGIVSEAGQLVVSYEYDAWGNVLEISGSMATTLGTLNPLTYRGYVYDHETGLYYLQSRYYNPEWGRFLNADALVSTGQGLLGNNMFAYCGNNPVNCCDPCGTCIHYWYLLGLVDCESCKAQKVKYSVPLYNQGNRSLCWAYCQVMVECYYSGKKISQWQANKRAKQIAIDVNGETNWDSGGWPTNRGERIEISNIQELFDIIAQNGPVYAYYWNGKTGEDSAAHLVLVTGVDLRRNKVYTNNPWGVRGAQSFSAFQSGVAKSWLSSGQGMTFRCIYLINQ